MSQVPAVSSSETEAQAPLEFYSETLQDLDVGADESANVKGGATATTSVIAVAPSPVDPGIRMTGTSILLPGR